MARVRVTGRINQKNLGLPPGFLVNLGRDSVFVVVLVADSYPMLSGFDAQSRHHGSQFRTLSHRGFLTDSCKLVDNGPETAGVGGAAEPRNRAIRIEFVIRAHNHLVLNLMQRNPRRCNWRPGVCAHPRSDKKGPQPYGQGPSLIDCNTLRSVEHVRHVDQN